MAGVIKYAWFVLWFNVAVILMGAVVRATGSGAGCGRSWPTCDGQIIPQLEGARAVEFTHRAVSGIALVLVVALAVSVWRQTRKGHPARTGAVLSVGAIIGEALIGAMIVLAEWVAHDSSIARALSVPLHLVNTLFLLAGLSLTIFWLKGGRRFDFKRDRALSVSVVLGVVALVFIAATGAVTALADTLFPKGGDIAGEEHFLTELRVVHPIFAIVVVLIAAGVAARGTAPIRRAAKSLAGLVALMLATGALNVVLAVPLWTQIVHLASADLLWIVYVFISAGALQVPAATESRLSPSR